jgi:hypothetical protein
MMEDKFISIKIQVMFVNIKSLAKPMLKKLPKLKLIKKMMTLKDNLLL